ncbi:MAG: hypothetical protein AAEJ04_05290, partial [Planctomycetota bacterium]
MGSTWAHLLVVHIPVLLSPVALFFLIRAMRSSATTDFKLAHSFVLICAIASIVAYLTGPTAAEWLAERIDMIQEQVENHGLWGRISFTVMVLAGAASLIAILAYLQGEEPHPWLAHVVFG